MSRSLLLGRRAAAALALGTGTLLVLASAASAVPRTADGPSGACTDPAGVTVVVDFTDTGGKVEVGCAEEAATGAAALVAAGFVDTRDASGLICAIDAVPDPCPTTFEGTYWSYWSATPDGSWEMYQEGPDTTVPEPGALEGWRYNDGSAGPSLSPAEVLAATATTESVPTAEDGADAADEVTSDGLPTWAIVLVAVALVGAVAATGVGLVRRRGQNGPAGQD